MCSLTVVCPVHNEAEVVELFYGTLNGVLDGIGDRYDSTILFVDDGSDDESLEILSASRTLTPTCTSCRYQPNSAIRWHWWPVLTIACRTR